jgi:hypothetical protein
MYIQAAVEQILRLPEGGKAHRLVVVVMINILSLEEDCEYSE